MGFSSWEIMDRSNDNLSKLFVLSDVRLHSRRWIAGHEMWMIDVADLKHGKSFGPGGKHHGGAISEVWW